MVMTGKPKQIKRPERAALLAGCIRGVNVVDIERGV